MIFEHQEIDMRAYAKYILRDSMNEEKRKLMGCFKSEIKLAKGLVTVVL